MTSKIKRVSSVFQPSPYKPEYDEVRHPDIQRDKRKKSQESDEVSPPSDKVTISTRGRALSYSS